MKKFVRTFRFSHYGNLYQTVEIVVTINLNSGRMDWDVFLRNDRCGNSVWRGFYIEDKDFFNWTIDLNDSRCPIRLTIEAKRNKAIYDAAFGYNCDIRMSLRSNVIHNDFKVPISSWNELPLTLIGI